ncbi:hypothetical protein EKD04_014580 [Chloroflexales bacterium ZM16-3]|nr:hypothetical protein [Chloroflexales bacterium ZM16-3]
MAAPLKRLPPSVIAADRELLRAVQSLGDYQPINGAYSIVIMQQQEACLTQAELAIVRLEEELKHARVVAIETANAMHTTGLGMKDQVIAQYGHDSTAIEIIGLTRKSAHKRPVRRKATA